ncbi:rRNA-processing protein fcf1, variant 2 [Taiwanofungus camphoratus]|nr:rRNA-processing protein fcf1, variant 2 [Antrodia cinnamomea]
MGRAKKTRKFAAVKRLLNPNDIRLYVPSSILRWLAGGCSSAVRKENQLKQKQKEEAERQKAVRRVPQVASSLFLQHNDALVPPYRVLIDTNFINFSLQNKLELISGMMDCLYAKCIPCVTDCVMAELEKLGHRYRVALRVARDPRFERLSCSHSGTYADDCLVQRVTSHKCYIVATCDRELRRRIRKIPGVPLMYIVRRRYAIERLPDQGAPV